MLGMYLTRFLFCL